MKFYKVFDYNSQYIAFWGSDLLKVIDDWKSYVIDNDADEYDENDEVKVRAFEMCDLNSDEYKNSMKEVNKILLRHGNKNI